MIVAVRFYGSALPPLALPDARRTFTIGSGDCDLVVPPELACGVAPVHAIAERVDGALRVCDHGSGHGLYRSPRSPRVAELLLHAGGVGWVGTCPILALDHRLTTLRPRLAWSMGLDAHAAIDDAITAVADSAPIALIGPANLDVMALVRAIHDAGTGRDLIMPAGTTVPSLATVDGTLVIDLDRLRLLAASRVEEIFATRCAARVIFLASDDRAVRRHLDVYAARVRTIALVPLSRRGDEIARLLQLVWRDELGSDRCASELDPSSLRGLAEHRWRGNLDELRAAAARLLAYAMHPSLRRAARALGVRHQTLAAHLTRIGVPIRDQADRDL